MAGAKRYRAYYIEPGLADYSAEGIGLVLVQKPALDDMSPTFVGKPVVNFEHTDLEPEQLLDSNNVESFADGVVAATGYDDEKAWYWADMLIWDDETQRNIEQNGYSVSCAYDVEHSQSGGSYHNVQYQEEVLDGVYKHMAIVPNPRYEDAWIIRNSKPGGTTVAFGKKKDRQNEMPKMDERENEDTMEEGYVMKEDGSKMPLSELVSAYREMQASDMGNGRMYNMEDMINVDGEEVSVADMMNRVMSNPGMHENAEGEDDEEMKNEADLFDVDMEDVIDESRQNSKPSKERGKANMQRVRNAATKSAEPVKPDVDTRINRLNRGKSRYGSPVQQTVKG